MKWDDPSALFPYSLCLCLRCHDDLRLSHGRASHGTGSGREAPVRSPLRALSRRERSRPEKGSSQSSRRLQQSHAAKQRSSNGCRSATRGSYGQGNDASIQRPIRRCTDGRSTCVSAYRPALSTPAPTVARSRITHTELPSSDQRPPRARPEPAGYRCDQRENAGCPEQQQGIARTLGGPTAPSPC